MAYEVIWTKLLGLIVGPTTYSFTLVLVTFITCLALGSLFFGWLGDKVRRPMDLLLYTQLGAALCALLISQVLGNSQLLFAKLLYHSKDHFLLMNVLKAGVLFAFMFLPTFFLGATFPLVGKVYTQSVSAVGHSMGVAYTLNTIGAVLGSFIAGFVLIPLTGKERGLSLVVALQILTCLVIAGITLARERRYLKWVPIAGPALVGLWLCLHYPGWNHRLLSMGRYQRFDEMAAQGVSLGEMGWFEALFQGPRTLAQSESRELVYYGDGIGGFTAVLQEMGPMGQPELVMTNSGKPDASTAVDMKTQTLLAHLPMLFHPNPESVMILGLASGITAGEVLYYPIQRLDVLEISPQVVEACQYFASRNNNVLSNPKTELIVQDGRAHLQLTDRRYDVIISEPSNPWMAGLAALFTQEFFTLARDRLNDGGMFVQFMHSYAMDWPVFALVGRTFAKVFPNSLFVTTCPDAFGTDFLFVGIKGKNPLALANAERRKSYAQQSKNVTVTDPNVLYRLILGEALPQVFGEGPVNTDSHPRLEFAAPRIMYREDPNIVAHLSERIYLTQETADIRQQVSTDVEGQLGFSAYSLSVGVQFSDMVDLSRATPSQRERFSALMERYSAQYTVDYSLLQDEGLKRRCHLTQIETLRNRIESMPKKYAVYYALLATFHSEVGMWEESAAYNRKALELAPDYVEAMTNLAWHLVVHRRAQGPQDSDLQEAIRLATRACELTRYHRPEAMDALAAAYAAKGMFPLAQTLAQNALGKARSSGKEALAEQIEKRLQLYGTGRAYVETMSTAPSL